jgi:hypothetical protein
MPAAKIRDPIPAANERIINPPGTPWGTPASSTILQ